VSAAVHQLAIQHEPRPASPANLTRRLQRFATNHQETLAAIYRRFGRGSPTVFLQQPEALLTWRAVDHERVSSGVAAADLADLRAIWLHPSGAPTPPPADTGDW
jgi:hypothetical protein